MCRLALEKKIANEAVPMSIRGMILEALATVDSSLVPKFYQSWYYDRRIRHSIRHVEKMNKNLRKGMVLEGKE